MSYHSWPWRDRVGRSRGDIVRCLDLETQRLRSEREELLGALRSVAIQAHPPNGSGLTQGDIKLEMERIALTAIAKAEGRTP